VVTVDNVLVTQGSIYTLPVKLQMSQQATTVEVSAATLSLDTTTATQTTSVTGTDLQTMPQNGRDFTQLIQLVPGYAGYSAGGYGSLKRHASQPGELANRWRGQQRPVAQHPGGQSSGVSGIAGIILPIDSVDQFSVQTQGSPESGRNPGGAVDLALKSGSNGYHGTVYYYDRNEAFAAASPFVTSKKEKSQLQLRVFVWRAAAEGQTVLFHDL